MRYSNFGEYNNWWDSFKDKRLTVMLEVTTECNAKCPQCPRTMSSNNKSLSLAPSGNYPIKSVSLEEFKMWFPPEILKGLKTVNFAGDFGDAGMNPDFMDIVDYIIKTDDTTSIFFNTNGSMHNDLWWWKLGMLARDRLTVVFAIDGIDNEMHAKYRVNTRLDRILQNMKALSETPAKIQTFTVLFKHNEDYLEEIKEMTKALGATDHEWVESSRFKETNYQEYEWKGKIHRLEQVTRKDRKQDINAISRKVRDYNFAYDKFETVECDWLKTNKIHVSIDGFVSPCCFVGMPNTRFRQTNSNRRSLDSISDLSLKFQSLESILLHYDFKEGLHKQLAADPAPICKRFCGKCDE